jgi:predicted RNA-binding protein YlxR (DUF448 family)
MPHTPLRRCRVCRQQLPKPQLTRWTVCDGVLERDPSQTAPGRGYYSCSTKCETILPKTIKTVKKA